VITPNKVIPLAESALGRVGAILESGPEPIDILALFRSVADNFESIDQFLLSMDVLYLLGLIDLDPVTRMVTYVN